MTVRFGKWDNQSLTISIKNSCITLNLSGEMGDYIVSYDYEGRLWTAMIENISYRRGLDGKILTKWIDRNQLRWRRWLTKAEAARTEEHAAEMAENFLRDYEQKNIALSGQLPAEILSVLKIASHYPELKASSDIEQYHQIYKPVGILPPDQYFSVVLQATEGCSFNTCTFCDFYRDRAFHIKDPAEFIEHCNNVLHFLGNGLSLRRTIFLGDANALVTPMEKLIPIFEIAHQYFNVEKLGGIYSFLDGFSGEKKSVQDYSILASLGLRRVYIGMESGNAELLRFIRKPGIPDELACSVRALKAGGVSVGIIVLLGAGGNKFYRKHIDDTIQIINKMQLDMEDIIYFSELIVSEDLQYSRDAFQHHLGNLSADQISLQAEEIERNLIFKTGEETPHISRYDIREFVY
jgi:hypothetical protein